MNVIVQSKTLVVTEAIRNFVVQHTRKFNRRGQKISHVTVFLEMISRKKNDAQSATAKFLIDLPGRNIVVQEKAQDLYLAISQAAKGAVRQMAKTKERRNSHAAHPKLSLNISS